MSSLNPTGASSDSISVLQPYLYGCLTCSSIADVDIKTPLETVRYQPLEIR